jgi:hypothetical protein
MNKYYGQCATNLKLVASATCCFNAIEVKFYVNHRKGQKVFYTISENNFVKDSNIDRFFGNCSDIIRIVCDTRKFTSARQVVEAVYSVLNVYKSIDFEDTMDNITKELLRVLG